MIINGNIFHLPIPKLLLKSISIALMPLHHQLIQPTLIPVYLSEQINGLLHLAFVFLFWTVLQIRCNQFPFPQFTSKKKNQECGSCYSSNQYKRTKRSQHASGEQLKVQQWWSKVNFSLSLLVLSIRNRTSHPSPRISLILSIPSFTQMKVISMDG